MTNPILYDFKKTMKSKAVLGIIIVLVLFGAFTVAVSSNAGAQGVKSSNADLWDYYTGTGYHFLGYAFDTYGAPIAGATFSVTASVGGSNINGGGKTNSSGFVSFEMPIPGSTGAGISVSVTGPGQSNPFSTLQSNLRQYSNNTCGQCNSVVSNIQSFNSPYSVIADSSNASKTELAFFEVGPNYSPPTNWGVYYKYYAVLPSQQTISQLTPSQMQLLGRLSGFETILPTPPTSTMQNLIFGIFTSTGGYVSVFEVNIQQIFQSQSQSQSSPSAQSFNSPVTTIVDSSNKTATELSVTELSPDGAPPSNWGLYYEYVALPPAQQVMNQLTPSQMQLLGHLNSIQTILPVPPGSTLNDIIFAVFTSSGRQVYAGWQPAANLHQQQCSNCQASQTADFWGYSTANGFDFLGYAFDAYGAPVAGANYTVSLSVGSSTYNKEGLTNSSGYVAFSVKAPTSSGAGVEVSVTFPGQQGPGWTQQGQVNSFSSQQNPSSFEFWGYATQSTYRFLGDALDGYGVPIAGVNYSVIMSVGSSTFHESGLTNSSGYVAFTVKAPTSGGAGVQVSASVPGQQQGQASWTSSNQVNAYSNEVNNGNGIGSVSQLAGSPATNIIDMSNKSMVEILWAELGTNGTAPPESDLYYKYTSTVPSEQTLQSMNDSQMHFLGSTKGVVTVLPVPPPPTSNATSIITGIFTPQGAIITIGSSTAAKAPSPSLTLASVLYPDLLFITPMVGILASFGAYGRERVSGILDSILTRPVSRRGLAISRYISVLLALAVASIIAVEVMAGLCSKIIGIPLGPVFQLALILGVFVDAAAFAGIVFVLSRVLRSTAMILGIAVILYFITTVITLFSIIPSSYVVTVAFLDPSRYVTMVISYLTNITLVSSSISSPSQFNPASIGLTALNLSADAAMWIAVPFAVFLYLAVKRD